MTAFSFFEAQLFVLYTGVGHVGLVLATGAAAALGFVLRQWPWAKADERTRTTARRVGLLAAAAVGITLLGGLRVGGTAYDPSAPAMLWESVVALISALGVTIAAYASGSALAAATLNRGPRVEPEPAARPLDSLEAAVAAFERLEAATDRLRRSEQDAATRAGAVADGVAAAEYVKAAEAIRHRLLLAEELRATTGAAVLRLACAAPLRRILERRPDAVLRALNARDAKVPLGQRVEQAVTAVRTFMRELEDARRELKRELAGEAGSTAQRLKLDAASRAQPIDAALGQIEATYGRVGHRLEALKLRVGADADAGAVAGAAMAVTGQPVEPPKDVVEVALEMTQAEQSAVTALAALGAEPARITEVVVQASAALARGSSDDEAMAEVLRSVRRELDR